MKDIGRYFILTFSFFLVGQIFWGISILIDAPLFGEKLLEELVIGHSFTLSGIFGLISGVKLYKFKI